MTGGVRRRHWIAGTAALAAAACRDAPDTVAGREGWTAAWVGAPPDRGHRLRAAGVPASASDAVVRRTQVLIVGAGIAGLAAARAFARRGVDDLRVLELEDAAGGASRGHRIAGIDCPLGAHYLPLPGAHAREVAEWLHEIGLLRSEHGRTVADERHLCHSPQERLFVDGAWVDGLLPPAEGRPATLAAYRRFAAAVRDAQRDAGFALPSHRAPWTGAHAVLDAQTFAAWLDAQGFVDERLRWYLDYCCRDDYGAPASAVSAWAGLHYFASRHGFAAPGDAEGERDAVFTWPEGNAWLVQRLAALLGERMLTGRTALAVDEGRHGVQVLAWDERAGRAEVWQASSVVLAVPLFVAARLLRAVPPALAEVAPRQVHAPWLVANLHLREPLLQRVGAPPAWDNVVYGASDLGYVDARHQSLSPLPGPTVLSAYHALAPAERAALLAGDATSWAQRVIEPLRALHPDLPDKLARIDLARHGHAMSVPVPGLRGHPALAALRRPRGRVRFAHADLAGYSVFEEAFTLGCEVAA